MEREVDAVLRRDETTLTQLVRRSVEIKAAVVSADEREAGRRVILNAGHTVAHALEQATAYQLPHGEAVALGLVAECALGEGLGTTERGTRRRVASLLERMALPVRLSHEVSIERVLEAMRRDKKNRMTRIQFALPSTIGCMDDSGGWTRAAEEPAIEAALKAILITSTETVCYTINQHVSTIQVCGRGGERSEAFALK